MAPMKQESDENRMVAGGAGGKQFMTIDDIIIEDQKSYR